MYLTGLIYRVTQNRTRTREVDLLDGLQKALNNHRSSVSSISVTENSTPLQGFEEVKDRKLG